eukprot:CAMPEP_0197033740 /NCGR_PEP_ID=MMETSP1384-20130603/12064_1 /TAXON_ID=29189 /ORGANISM="Ammonia sp." /LENGTH=318 /DNA_ID=CAMNT_0042463589 /DNA_START=61 /DNA_END=1017 /DNA_ORIENTATION=+
MGNQSCTTSATCSSPHKQVRNRDRFIVQYSSQQRAKEIARQTVSAANKHVDQRRVVFISLLGLYQTWKQCPPYLLYSALVIIPMKSSWIYRPRKHKEELRQSLLAQLSVFSQNPKQVNEFVKLLKWKDAQGLVIWALDDFEPRLEDMMEGDDTSANLDALMAPFWRYVSHKLTSMIDPMTGNNYKALKDTAWWQTSYDASMSQQDSASVDSEKIRVKSILAEMFFVSMKWRLMSEILYQSNPGSLNPVTFYDASAQPQPASATDEEAELEGDTECRGEDESESHLSDGWWISPEYDPYDIEQPIVYDSEHDENAEEQH